LFISFFFLPSFLHFFLLLYHFHNFQQPKLCNSVCPTLSATITSQYLLSRNLRFPVLSSPFIPFHPIPICLRFYLNSHVYVTAI
jgi:hypothetical protein